MTEYELLELLTSTSLAAMEMFSNYLTLLASYLVVAYLVGDKLTTVQVITISILFLIGLLVTTYSSYNYMSRAVELADQLEAMYADRTYGAQPLARDGYIGIQILGVMAGLKIYVGRQTPKDRMTATR